MRKISEYFCDLAKSKDRMLKIFYNAALPGSVLGMFTLSGKVALGVTGLLIIHEVMRDIVSQQDYKSQKPAPK
jgi:hypothetical protein